MAKNFGIEERKIKGILSVGTAFTYKTPLILYLNLENLLATKVNLKQIFI